MTPEDHKWVKDNCGYAYEYSHNTVVIAASKVREYLDREKLLTPSELKQSGGIEDAWNAGINTSINVLLQLQQELNIVEAKAGIDIAIKEIRKLMDRKNEFYGS